MSELYGGPAGQEIGEAGQRQQNLTNMHLAQGYQALQQANQMNPMLLQQERLTIGKMQLDQDIAKNMQQYMLANPPKGDELPSEIMNRFARAALAGGDTKTAFSAFSKSAQITKDAALTQESELRKQLDGYKIEHEFATDLGMWLGGATDQASYDAVRAKTEAATGHKMNWPAEYSPEVVEQLVNQTMTAKDRLSAQRSEAENKSKEEQRAARIDMWDTKKKLDQELLEIKKRREARMEKNTGTKALNGPKKEDIDQAFNLIIGEYPEFKDAKDPAVLSAAYDVAQRAKAMVRDNPGLDMGTALHKAMQEAADSGELAHTTVPKTFFGVPIGEDKKATYRQQGLTPDKPAPVTDKLKADDLIKGRYYSKGGVTKQYLGDGKFGPPTDSSKPRAAAGTYKGAPDVKEDDDDDDEGEGDTLE